MKENSISSNNSFREQLEKYSTKELIEILIDNGQSVTYRADKETLINLILKMMERKEAQAKKEENNFHLKLVENVDKDALKNAIRHFFLTIFLVMLIQVLINFFKFLQIFDSKPFECSDSNNYPLPSNAICYEGKVKCIENYILLNGFCLLNQSNSEQLSLMIGLTKNKLKKRAGLYKCNKAQNDWMSQEEIENSLIKKFYAKTKNNFTGLFNLTIEFLTNEPDIITKNIENSPVFAATEYTESMMCSLKSFIYKNTLIISGALVLNIYFFYIRRKSIYDVQADQCLRPLVKFIKSFNGNYISQTEVRQYLDPMVENPDAVWKYVKRKLKKSRAVGWKKEGRHIYFYSRG